MKRADLERLLAAQEPRFRAAFYSMLRTVRERRGLKELERLMANREWDKALDVMESAAAAMGQVWTTAFAVAAARTVAFMATRGVLVSYDATNWRAVERMRANRLALVQGLSQDTRRAVREVLEDGVRRGLNPRAQARLFRDSIGLTTRQARAVESYRRSLELGQKADALGRSLRDRRFDPTVAKDEPLSAAQVDRMVERYRDRMVAWRAETIARTEAMAAVHEGQEEAYAQAVEDGVLSPNTLEQRWNAQMGDKRTRDTHRAMHGQVRAWGEKFQSPSGALLAHPGDRRAPPAETISCRCVRSVRIVSLESPLVSAVPGLRLSP